MNAPRKWRWDGGEYANSRDVEEAAALQLQASVDEIAPYAFAPNSHAYEVIVTVSLKPYEPRSHT